MTLLENIENHRKESGLTKADMARMFSVSSQRYNNWVYRGSISKDSVSKAEQILGINKVVSFDGALSIDDVWIDVMDVTASMGYGSAIPENEQVIRRMLVSKKWCLEALLTGNPERIKIITGRGSSMKPTIGPGDAVFVDTSNTDVRKDGVFVIKTPDDIIIKRLEFRPDQTVRVISDNTIYDPYSKTIEEFSEWTVCGRVIHVWSGKKID